MHVSMGSRRLKIYNLPRRYFWKLSCCSVRPVTHPPETQRLLAGWAIPEHSQPVSHTVILSLYECNDQEEYNKYTHVLS